MFLRYLMLMVSCLVRTRSTVMRCGSSGILRCHMNPITHDGKVVSVPFGSYGWSGERVDNIMDRLMQVRIKVMDSLEIKLRPSKGEIEQCIDFGRWFADALNTGVVPVLPKKRVRRQLTTKR